MIIIALDKLWTTKRRKRGFWKVSVGSLAFFSEATMGFDWYQNLILVSKY